MRSVSIAYHYIHGRGRSAFPLPVDEIALVFHSAGIAMVLSEATELPLDPNIIGDSYATIVARLHGEPMGRGHLYIGGMPPLDVEDAAGELLDLAWRRAAVVYTESRYIDRNRHSGLLQTAVHELGHMLNLDHPERFTVRPTAMSSYPDRKGDFDAVWNDEAEEARRIGRQGGAHYFIEPSRRIACLPFAHGERRRLQATLETRILPGGSPYEFTGHHLHD